MCEFVPNIDPSGSVAILGYIPRLHQSPESRQTKKFNFASDCTVIRFGLKPRHVDGTDGEKRKLGCRSGVFSPSSEGSPLPSMVHHCIHSFVSRTICCTHKKRMCELITCSTPNSNSGQCGATTVTTDETEAYRLDIGFSTAGRETQWVSRPASTAASAAHLFQPMERDNTAAHVLRKPF